MYQNELRLQASDTAAQQEADSEAPAIHRSPEIIKEEYFSNIEEQIEVRKSSRESERDSAPLS
jgi:hypothetical protein